MKWLLAAFLLLAPAAAAQPAATSATGVATAMTPTPDDRAKQWLNLVDDGNYAEAWKQAGGFLRDHAKADVFAQSVGGVRMPCLPGAGLPLATGPFVSRTALQEEK